MKIFVLIILVLSMVPRFFDLVDSYDKAELVFNIIAFGATVLAIVFQAISLFE